ncbi:expressed protein [Phakopsora pachyrhizi]|uniref:Expressed protein n=1 Tax=Phakopsora pachyrhizi TaxID=170000 RepID=A0AAV0BG52_PHAPC|nr:expressed protein [Phakopsora pachyrhizi]
MSPGSTRRRAHVIPFGHPYSCTPILNQIFESNKSPSHGEVTAIMTQTGLKRKQITSWFWRKRKEALDINCPHQRHQFSSDNESSRNQRQKKIRTSRKGRRHLRDDFDDEVKDATYKPPTNSINSPIETMDDVSNLVTAVDFDNQSKVLSRLDAAERFPLNVSSNLRPLNQRTLKMENLSSSNDFTEPGGLNVQTEGYQLSPSTWFQARTECYCQPSLENPAASQQVLMRSSPCGEGIARTFVWPQMIEAPEQATGFQDLQMLLGNSLTDYPQCSKFFVQEQDFSVGDFGSESVDHLNNCEEAELRAQSSVAVDPGNLPFNSGPSSRTLYSDCYDFIPATTTNEFSTSNLMSFGEKINELNSRKSEFKDSREADTDLCGDYSNLLSSSTQDCLISSPNSSLVEQKEGENWIQKSDRNATIDSLDIESRKNSTKTLTSSFKQLEEDHRLFKFEEQLRDFMVGGNLFDQDDLEAFFNLTQAGTL